MFGITFLVLGLLALTIALGCFFGFGWAFLFLAVAFIGLFVLFASVSAEPRKDKKL